MKSLSTTQTRFARFSVWALAACGAWIAAIEHGTHNSAIVPACFMVLFVPAVLLPFHSKKS